jgi:hypothetical protein
VQQFGLELLILADGWKATEQDEKEFEDRLKFALVAAGLDATELWPQDAADVPEDDGDVEYDYSAVNWQDGSADDWELMQQQLATSRVQVSNDVQEAEAEPPVPEMGEEFDREWQ